MNEDNIYLGYKFRYKKDNKTYIAKLYSRVLCRGCCFVDGMTCDAHRNGVHGDRFKICHSYIRSGYLSSLAQINRIEII